MDLSLKIGLIVDDRMINSWQANCLRELEENSQFVVYNCSNAKLPRKSLRHALYYLLNCVSLRSKLTARVGLPTDLNIVEEISFTPENDGAWHRLPSALLQHIEQDQPDFILKFGMGLLFLDEKSDQLPPILSYHHGDPRKFRGRPAGFYEVMLGRDTVGQVIQILSNTIDAGQVIAFAETKAHRHSYRTTMLESYRCSPLLIRTAVRNLHSGKRLSMRPASRLHRLPDNRTVAKFMLRRFNHLVRRWASIAFIEKKWEVAQAPSSMAPDIAFASFPEPDRWQIIKPPKQYRFLADPFFHPSGHGVLVEALRKSTGLGEILHISRRGYEVLSRGAGHYSYPGTFAEGGHDYVLPEISDWSVPRIFCLRGSLLEECGSLDVPNGPRMLDPTLHAHDGIVYLFANCASEGNSVLRLWIGSSILAPFTEHPLSPIRIAPVGSRMGGAIYEREGQRYRIGQDFRQGYGDGTLLFRINKLTPTDYEEVFVGALHFSGLAGPHTVNFAAGTVLFDFYSSRFSVLAGFRRLRSRIQRHAI